MHLDSQDNKKRRVGFSCAINGIKSAISSEINIKIHLIATIIVIFVGFLFQISLFEWAILLLTIGSVLSFEMINTAMERAMDYLAPEFHPLVGLVKDLSAGAVFISALTSILVGSIIFLPKIIQLIW
ncbi:diacylglycerol kinase family protein [Aquibacillus rhizosphaerae]|uniref:Diacylglycerol kinase family protein n=1 Tax=Aquibacillus rhizosphaerae TaxID=3051431 RepID=A0ABT7L8F8_9BACI|nr:diacylglycerol kinase family protein [Aquibacillus sp. LR5S19]MDL4841507.1 diacylglycerol kinase family protein [Aquibacillus sp. LR5S19]